MITFHSPAILVRDMDEALQFYEVLLGQKVEFRAEGYTSFSDGFSLWQADAACSFIFGDDIPPGFEEAGGMEMYFETDNIEDTLAAVEQAGTEIIHKIKEQPWGQRCARVFDPDGRVVEFAESMNTVVVRLLKSGMTKDEVAARTMLPVAMVDAMAEGLPPGGNPVQ